MSARGRSEASNAFTDFEKTFVAAVAKEIDALTIIPPRTDCNGGAGGIISALGTITFPGEGTATATNTINFPDNSSAYAALANAAVKRCANPSAPANTSPAQAGFYFCFQLRGLAMR